MCSPGINAEGELRGQPAKPGSPGKMAIKTECVSVTDSPRHCHQMSTDIYQHCTDCVQDGNEDNSVIMSTDIYQHCTDCVQDGNEDIGVIMRTQQDQITTTGRSKFEKQQN